MSDVQVSRWAGAFGIASFVVFLVALPLYFFGATIAPTEDTARFNDYDVTSIRTAILIRTSLADPLIFVGFLVFLAGFRHLIRQAQQEYEWLATLVFGVGVLLFTLELVGDGLEAGAALDTVARAEPSCRPRAYGSQLPAVWRDRPGDVGSLVGICGLRHRCYEGAAQMDRLVCLRQRGGQSGIRPVNLGGTDYTAFWSAPGWVTFIAQAALAVWFLIASISTLLKQDLVAPMAHADGADASPFVRACDDTLAALCGPKILPKIR